MENERVFLRDHREAVEWWKSDRMQGEKIAVIRDSYPDMSEDYIDKAKSRFYSIIQYFIPGDPLSRVSAPRIIIEQIMKRIESK